MGITVVNDLLKLWPIVRFGGKGSINVGPNYGDLIVGGILLILT